MKPQAKNGLNSCPSKKLLRPCNKRWAYVSSTSLVPETHAGHGAAAALDAPLEELRHGLGLRAAPHCGAEM